MSVKNLDTLNTNKIDMTTESIYFDKDLVINTRLDALKQKCSQGLSSTQHNSYQNNSREYLLCTHMRPH